MYYLIYALLYAISLLPLRFLYLISDVAYVILYRIVGYRKDIIMSNLQLAFPEKTSDEHRKIAKDFYINFVDNFMEMLKLISASKKFIGKHFTLDNPEMLEHYYAQGKKCQMHLGHMFNWEMANIAMPFDTAYAFIVVYMPLTNKIFNRLLIHLRSRTGTILIRATHMSREILPYRNTQYMLVLVADQSPGDSSNSYWLDFFGYPTPFVRGPERGARAGNIPAIFVDFYKPKRGYYRARLELGSENPAELPEGELTRRYVDFLERSIREKPSMWLWSHRRWKHKWSPEYAKMWIGKKGIGTIPNQ
ncbi:MAG: lysophospholipid acyltransferase family protein [Bacteroidetes bacterium]|nr:lysophospholipid acyltransferase family protein [Bacteroidota bacterium]